MFQTLTSPVVFAHRGASTLAPENTLEAFQLALDQGARAIEMDVQLTQDQEVVVFHDIHLDRTTDGSGRVKDHPLAEIKRLNAAISFNPAYQHASIPTLGETLDFLPDDILINIELKNLHSPFNNLPSRTAEVIQAKRAERRVLVSSFNTVALYRFHRVAPSVPRGLILRSRQLANIYRSFPAILAKIQSVHLSYKALSPALISDFRRMELKIFSYTLNHTQDILSAIKMGIDGFFTDDPGFAHRILIQNQLMST